MTSATQEFNARAQQAEPFALQWEAAVGPASLVAGCAINVGRGEEAEGWEEEDAEGVFPTCAVSRPLPLGGVFVTGIEGDVTQREGSHPEHVAWFRAGLAGGCLETPADVDPAAFLASGDLGPHKAGRTGTLRTGVSASVWARRRWFPLTREGCSWGQEDEDTAYPPFPASLAPGWRREDGDKGDGGEKVAVGEWGEVTRSESVLDSLMERSTVEDFEVRCVEEEGVGSLRVTHRPSAREMLHLKGKKAFPTRDLRNGVIEVDPANGAVHLAFQHAHINPMQPQVTETLRRKVRLNRRVAGQQGEVMSSDHHGVLLRSLAGEEFVVPAGALAGTARRPFRVRFLIDSRACRGPGGEVTVQSLLSEEGGETMLGETVKFTLPQPRSVLQWQCECCRCWNRREHIQCWKCCAGRPAKGIVSTDLDAAEKACGHLWNPDHHPGLLGQSCIVNEVLANGQALLCFGGRESRWFPIQLVSGPGGQCWQTRTLAPELRMVAGWVGHHAGVRCEEQPEGTAVDLIERADLPRLFAAALRAAAHSRPDEVGEFLARFLRTRGAEWDAATLTNWDAAPVHRLLEGVGGEWPRPAPRALRRGASTKRPSGGEGTLGVRGRRVVSSGMVEEEERVSDEDWLAIYAVELRLEKALHALVSACPRPASPTDFVADFLLSFNPESSAP
eukprot:Hpha_TRINITY_DN269_c0_g1::TRINITY_DN269_c0_g1_i1::g.83539::m.83539